MELQIPALNQIQEDLTELKQLVGLLNPERSNVEYIPKTRMKGLYDISTSTLRNREQDGSLTVYKIGNRTYYKLSEINSLLEKSVKK